MLGFWGQDKGRGHLGSSGATPPTLYGTYLGKVPFDGTVRDRERGGKMGLEVVPARAHL